MSVATTWGTTPEERRFAFPCDRLVQDSDAEYYRGITVEAAPEVIFRWLCQLRVSSYSYLGPRGPRELPAEPNELAPGQQVMNVFEVAEFERGRHLTIRLIFRTREARSYALVIRELAVSYLIVSQGESVRLLVKMPVRYRRGPAGQIARVLLPWADFVMTRKQLMNLKRLAEATAD